MVGPEIKTSLALIPTEIPRNDKLRASAVPEEVKVVFEEAYNPTDCTVWTGTEMMAAPPLYPTEAAPRPDSDSERASMVVELDCPAVLPRP